MKKWRLDIQIVYDPRPDYTQLLSRIITESDQPLPGERMIVDILTANERNAFFKVNVAPASWRRPTADF
ncbi:unnamed protein product [Gemmataceae bacterium]|nr:unnamed protein product [Gemmataceae bacterium]VTT99595.1 unnamed protein product [Gemmataceae bacterium]